LTIRWAPGHKDITGNERADQEAKRAAQDGSSPIKDIPTVFRGRLPYSKSAIKQDYNAELKAKVLREWEASPRYARTIQYDRRLLKGSYLAIAD
ncbi:hypothetical protein C8R44DRAFT_564880, partial [Mycena epipterygia]